MSAAFDVKSMLWRTSPASTELEEVVLDWLRQMLGLDTGMSGFIYDTASVSSMHAIAAAREGVELRIREEGMSGRQDLPLLRAYASEQAHSSIDKGIITLGLGQRGLRKIPTDNEFRMDPSALADAIDEDKRNGFLPFCVVATVGTTSTSSIDPVPAIVPICEQYAMWLHVDAAYGGSAAIVPEMQHILDGCRRADSLVLNPHKWLFTPFDLSVLYCRHLDLLRRAFSLVPEYLRTPEQEKVRSGSDYGVQLGRRFRALKLWMIVRYFGACGTGGADSGALPAGKALRFMGRSRSKLGVDGADAVRPGVLSRLPLAFQRVERSQSKTPRRSQRSHHARRQRHRQSLSFAHEVERQSYSTAFDRKYSHV